MHPRTELLMAIRSNALDQVAKLIKQVHPAEELESGKTAMYVAYLLRNKDCMRVIAENKKADAKDEGQYGRALINLINENDIDTARILLNSGASTAWFITENNDSGLHCAVRNNNKQMLLMLLSFDFNITCQNGKERNELTPIQLAMTLGHTELAAIIAKNKNTITASTRYHKSALLTAIITNNAELTAEFIQYIDPAKELKGGKTAMQIAYASKSTACIQAIATDKRDKAAVKGKYGDVLLSLINEGDIKTARILLQAGTLTTWFYTSTRDSGLHCAVRNDNQPMLAMLLSFNLDLTQENSEKLTPIQLAMKLERTECARIIARSRKNDPADKARYGDALLIAVDRNDLKTARILLEAGAPTTRWYFDHSGDKAPHNAVRHDNPEMVALLLKFNCDFEARSKSGQTPLQLGNILKHTALEKGWQIHNDAPKVKELFLLFALSIREPGSNFFKLRSPDYRLVELIGSFVYRQISDQKQTVQSTRSTLDQRIPDRIVRISAKKLIAEFHGATRRHSPEAIDFIENLKKDLEKPECTRAHIYRRTSEFLNKNKGRRTRDLIEKYKLTTFAPPTQIPESKRIEAFQLTDPLIRKPS